MKPLYYLIEGVDQSKIKKVMNNSYKVLSEEGSLDQNYVYTTKKDDEEVLQQIIKTVSTAEDAKIGFSLLLFNFINIDYYYNRSRQDFMNNIIIGGRSFLHYIAYVTAGKCCHEMLSFLDMSFSTGSVFLPDKVFYLDDEPSPVENFMKADSQEKYITFTPTDEFTVLRHSYKSLLREIPDYPYLKDLQIKRIPKEASISDVTKIVCKEILAEL